MIMDATRVAPELAAARNSIVEKLAHLNL